MSRPTATVYDLSGNPTSKAIPIPDVFQAPIRTDIVRNLVTLMQKNTRQPYAVSVRAGHRPSAASWGTGRAVSRIPRVNGSGTHRAGQGAFGNMCRGGRMFAPTKIWRKWGVVITMNERRYGICSAIAASGVTPLVMARGHRVEALKELPFVVDDQLESVKRTKDARAFFEAIGLAEELEKVLKSKRNRAGNGKMRDRKFTQKIGPLVIYKNALGINKAVHGIKGVDSMSVNNMNLRYLAPGSQVGRLIIWTESAFKELATRFGSYDNSIAAASLTRRGRKAYKLPQAVMKNTDLGSIVLSDAIVAAVRDPKVPSLTRKRKVKKRNPFKSYATMRRLNPYFETELRNKVLAQRRRRIHAAKLREDPAYEPPKIVKRRIEKEQKMKMKWRNSKLIQTVLKEDE